MHMKKEATNPNYYDGFLRCARPFDCVVFKSLSSDSEISLSATDNDAPSVSVEIRRMNGAWELYNVGDTITLNAEDNQVMMRGNAPEGFGGKYVFSMSGVIAADGELSSLIGSSVGVLPERCFYGLFKGCTSLVQPPKLSSTSINTACYRELFMNCTGLLTAPALPALQLAAECYMDMFSGCSSLVHPPVLPSLTMTPYCYSGMFSRCTSLIEAPELPSMELANDCYSDMFSECKSLTVPPALPATKVAPYCYKHMFGESGLLSCPELPAIELEDWCYYTMFSTTPITEPCALPATKLAFRCYGYMFGGCPNLEYSPDLPAEEPVEWCYGNMFGNSAIKRAGSINLKWADTLSCYVMFQRTKLEHLPVFTNPEFNWEAVPGSSNAYQSMFEGCTELCEAPQVMCSRDSVLQVGQFYSTFAGCVKITNCPEFPSMHLARNCYRYTMGGTGCVHATSELPAEVLPQECYRTMFANCINLVTAPRINGKEHGTLDCVIMFDNCPSLTTPPPELYANSLKWQCFNGMFRNCTSLTESPKIKATGGEAQQACINMFNGCTSLRKIEVDFTAWTSGGNNDTRTWVNNVSQEGVFVKPAALPDERGVDRIPANWTVVNKEDLAG